MLPVCTDIILTILAIALFGTGLLLGFAIADALAVVLQHWHHWRARH